MRAILIAIGIFAIVLVIITIRQSLGFRRLARSRAGEGFEDFSNSLPGVPEEIKRKVYEYVQNHWTYEITGLAVHADDNIDLYPLDDDEIEEAIFSLAEACEKERPLLNVWKGNPISTIGDLAKLIAHLPAPGEARGEGSRRLWTDK